MNPINQFRLDGKVALVTGSTRGIGRSIACGLAQAGAKVWIHGRESAEGEQLEREIGGRFIKGDLSDANQIAKIAQTIAEEESALDILVNNAGFETIMPFESYRMSVFDLIMQVNLRAPVELTKMLLPLLKRARSASIVNVTSIHAQTPAAHNSAYCMSKAALDMFTATLAVELGPLGIRVNNLAPGAIRTDMNSTLIDNLGPGTFDEWVPLGTRGHSR